MFSKVNLFFDGGYFDCEILGSEGNAVFIKKIKTEEARVLVDVPGLPKLRKSFPLTLRRPAGTGLSMEQYRRQVLSARHILGKL